MPPRAPSTSALRALRAQIDSRPFQCRNCTLQPGPQRVRPYRAEAACFPLPLASTTTSSRNCRNPQTVKWRHIAHVAPVTSVNAKPTVPARFTELHAGLKDLGTAAENYTPLSQVHLALRGLETEDAVIRVGVLAIGGTIAARRLVRVLLADPLGEKQAWEDTLLEEDGKSVLVQYGEEFSIDDRSPVLRRMSVPSILLQRNKLELLVSATEVTEASGEAEEEAESVNRLLRIELGTRSSGARPETLYQTHKTLVVGEGMRGAENMFHTLSNTTGPGADLVQGVVDLDIQNLSQQSSLDKVAFLNISEAEAAIQSFRESLSNSFKYEHGWLDSNVDSASAFLTAGISPDPTAGPLKPIFKTYISFILSGTKRAISSEAAQRHASLSASLFPPRYQTNLRAVLDTWAEFGHVELRDALTNALRSATWRRLKWWKLPWRVDDVGLLLNDILQRAYLVNAEKHLLWIGGYFRAIGLILAEHPDGNTVRTHPLPKTSDRWFDALPEESEFMHMYREEAGTTAAKDGGGLVDEDTVVAPPRLSSLNPWPQQIAHSRAKLQELVLPLQLRAQAVVLRTLSLSGLSSAVAALAFVNVSDVGVYEAGSVAALGTVLALRALQKDWEVAKRGWVEAVRLEGKEVLEKVERRGKVVVKAAVEEAELRVASGGDGREDRERAAEAVEKVRSAIETLQDSHSG